MGISAKILNDESESGAADNKSSLQPVDDEVVYVQRKKKLPTTFKPLSSPAAASFDLQESNFGQEEIGEKRQKRTVQAIASGVSPVTKRGSRDDLVEGADDDELEEHILPDSFDEPNPNTSPDYQDPRLNKYQSTPSLVSPASGNVSPGQRHSGTVVAPPLSTPQQPRSLDSGVINRSSAYLKTAGARPLGFSSTMSAATSSDSGIGVTVMNRQAASRPGEENNNDSVLNRRGDKLGLTRIEEGSPSVATSFPGSHAPTRGATGMVTTSSIFLGSKFSLNGSMLAL